MLFDILIGFQSKDVTASIREHLMRLLNARRGSLHHLPDYGLPDIGEIYQGLPYSLARLKLSLQQLIEKYEPRLKSVVIAHKPLTETDTVLCLTITASTHMQQKILFETYFLSGGRAYIKN